MTYQPDPAVKNAQLRARRHGLRLSTRANTFTLRDSNGHTVACGEDLASVAAHIPGHTMAETPPEWEQLIGEHLRMLTAAGRPPASIRLRRDQLTNMARSLQVPPLISS
ncbi:MAG: hypothetical protein ABR885_14070 [Mycobacterium sp.]